MTATQTSWGRWMRVEVVSSLNHALGSPSATHDEVVNLYEIKRIKPITFGTRVFFQGDTFIDTTTHFEVFACALMLSEGPRPPLTREELPDGPEIQQEWDEYIGSLR